VIPDSASPFVTQRKHPQWAVLKERARATSDLVAAYADRGQLEKARRTYDRLCQLAEEHPELREIQARAGSNLVAAYAGRGQLDAAQKVADALAFIGHQLPSPSTSIMELGDTSARVWAQELYHLRNELERLTMKLGEALPDTAMIREVIEQTERCMLRLRAKHHFTSHGPDAAAKRDAQSRLRAEEEGRAEE
jgi:regulator of sirC expression with transglutaminase-like and TPR domain